MNILVINQPTNNRGDESAHRGLMRALGERFPNANITILFEGASEDSVKQIEVRSPRNTYILVPLGNLRIYSLTLRLGLKFDLMSLFSYLHPTHREISKHLKHSDLIVCAPGGICMGTFQYWPHIYWLRLALKYNKKVAYYSRSFGPFPTETKWNRLFKKTSLYLLKHFSFLSIRDAKTMDLADKMGIQYIKSIDSAFLDTPSTQIPPELAPLVNNSEYMIFVPNALTWHNDFTNINQASLDSMYVDILKLMLSEHPNTQILMLPQLFNSTTRDEIYFDSLKKMCASDRVTVVSDRYSSDIQQAIIAKSKLIIGARYHSIVFAINNNVPFVALSYEHKIAGLLKILGKEDRMVDIANLAKGDIDTSAIVERIKVLSRKAEPDPQAKENARRIALLCMDAFVDKFKNS